jgi:hypothetical protein
MFTYFGLMQGGNSMGWSWMYSQRAQCIHQTHNQIEVQSSYHPSPALDPVHHLLHDVPLALLIQDDLELAVHILELAFLMNVLTVKTSSVV